MTAREALRAQRETILRVADANGASNVRVFGSVARGEDTDASDLDLLVDLPPDVSILEIGGLMMALREALGCNVDVVTEDLLRPHVRERALREARPV